MAAPPQTTPPQATSLAQAQTAPQEAAPPTVAAPAAAAPPDQAQLLQKIARDLATLERNIEQLRANQQQMASDNSKAIGELKASQEEMKRTLAKASEQPPPKGVTACRAAGSGRAQARADVSAAAGESAASVLPEGEWIYDDW